MGIGKYRKSSIGSPGAINFIDSKGEKLIFLLFFHLKNPQNWASIRRLQVGLLTEDLNSFKIEN
jgi:hypothetical protein